MNRYFFTNSDADARELERERLECVGRVHHESTMRSFDAVGVGAGWRCWDVGAGSGVASRLLADRVGPGGSVLATDVDTSLLFPYPGNGVTALQHNVLHDAPPCHDVDLVHARLLLMHLDDPATSIRNMAAALRPGGWLVIGDLDFTSCAPITAMPEFTTVWAAVLSAMERRGTNIAFGPKLPNLLRAGGLTEIGAEQWSEQFTGGSFHARATLLSMLRARAALLEAGSVTAHDFDRCCSYLQSPESVLNSSTIWTVWARKPGGR